MKFENLTQEEIKQIKTNRIPCEFIVLENTTGYSLPESMNNEFVEIPPVPLSDIELGLIFYYSQGTTDRERWIRFFISVYARGGHIRVKIKSEGLNLINLTWQ